MEVDPAARHVRPTFDQEETMSPHFIIMVLAAGCLLAAPAAGQGGPLCPPARSMADSTERKPDLVIRASASAESVRFSSEPRIDVRLTGCSVLDTVKVIERRNLPRPVQPNVTYHNVFVAVEILGHLDARCLLSSLGAVRLDSVAVGSSSLTSQLCGAGTDTVPQAGDAP
jgi:hypothetical protein